MPFQCHNFFVLILQVAEEIWVCEKGTVTKWEGGILNYKEHLKTKVLKENARAEKEQARRK